jgi:hypothetical protein
MIILGGAAPELFSNTLFQSENDEWEAPAVDVL